MWGNLLAAVDEVHSAVSKATVPDAVPPADRPVAWLLGALEGGDELAAPPLFHDVDEPPVVAPGETPWLEYWDESAQARYWYNQITQEASWVEPDPNDVVKAPEEPEPDPEGMVPPGPNWTAAIDDQTGKETWVNDATGEVLKAGGAAVDDRSVGSKGSTGKKGPRARRRIKSKGG